MNTVVKQNIDLDEIVFAHKNREYGAYTLRKAYPKHLTWAMWISIIFFLVATGGPVIAKMLTPAKKLDELKSIQTTNKLANVKDKKQDKKDTIVPELKTQPVKATTAFLPPVVKPDELVKDTALIPTMDELKGKQVGKVTQKGDTTGGDFEFAYEEKKEEPKVVEQKHEEAQVFTYVEEMPSFPGGVGEMMQFFKANIQYPEIARRAGVEGKIYVSFVVSAGGGISGAQIVKGIGAGCDEEALRVVSLMPKWNPGKQNGNSVNVRVSIPIIFKLN